MSRLAALKDQVHTILAESQIQLDQTHLAQLIDYFNHEIFHPAADFVVWDKASLEIEMPIFDVEKNSSPQDLVKIDKAPSWVSSCEDNIGLMLMLSNIAVSRNELMLTAQGRNLLTAYSRLLDTPKA